MYVAYSDYKRKQCVSLRRQGWSLNRLALELEIAKSTASLWCREITLNDAAIKQLIEKGFAAQAISAVNRSKTYKDAVEAAIKDADALWLCWKDDPLFTLGVGLYMGEGSKRSVAFSLANSDAGIIQTWITWCKTFAKDKKFLARIVVHSKDQVEPAKLFWENILAEYVEIRSISIAVSSASKHKRPSNRLPNGTLTIYMSKGNVYWHARMLRWITLTGEKYK